MITIQRRHQNHGFCLICVASILGSLVFLYTMIVFGVFSSDRSNLIFVSDNLYVSKQRQRIESLSTVASYKTFIKTVATGLPVEDANTSGFDHVTSLVLFIGYPRSGHTLVASLLDAHPHVAISNEYKLLHHWLLFSKKQKTRNYVFDELYHNSVMQSQTGYRSATVKHTFNYSVPNQWNGQYDKFLQLVGDKHGPETTHFLRNKSHQTIVDEISQRLKVGVRFLHVVRNPLDDIATMTVRKVKRRQFIEQGKVLNNSHILESQIRFYFFLISTNSLLLQRYNVLNIYSEDLIARPKSVISKICKFLDLKCSTSYLSDCARIVFGNVSRTRNNVVWTSEQRKFVDDAIREYSFLTRYVAETNAIINET